MRKGWQCDRVKGLFARRCSMCVEFWSGSDELVVRAKVKIFQLFATPLLPFVIAIDGYFR